MKLILSPNGKFQSISDDSAVQKGDLRSDSLSFLEQVDFSLEIQLPNTHCNIGGSDPTIGQRACFMCPRNSPRFRPDADCIDEVCERLNRYSSQIRALSVLGVAEPFWEDRIFAVLEKLRIGPESDTKVSTVTNGSLLEKNVRERWFETVPRSKVHFSIDATTPETYIRLRRINEYQRVVKNAFDFGHKRDPERHQAVLANNINLWNLDELNEMVRMTSDFTYHYMSIVPTSPTHAELKSICLSDENRSEFVAATKKAQNLADELGVNIVFQETWPKSQ